MAKEICDVVCIDEEKVERVQHQLAEQNPLEVAKIFNALSYDTPIKISYALTREDKL